MEPRAIFSRGCRADRVQPELARCLPRVRARPPHDLVGASAVSDGRLVALRIAGGQARHQHPWRRARLQPDARTWHAVRAWGGTAKEVDAMMRRAPLRTKPKPRPQRPDRSAEFASWQPMRRTGVYAMSGNPRPAPKPREPVRDADYRRLVAALPCILCRCVGHSQAAHGNRGKGIGMKTCDLTCFPACTVSGNDCHGKWDRYEFGGADAQASREPELSAATRLRLMVDAEDDPKTRRMLERVGLL